MTPLEWADVVNHAKQGIMFNMPVFNPADFILVIDSNFKYRDEVSKWPALFLYEVDDVEAFTGVKPMFGCVLCAR